MAVSCVIVGLIRSEALFEQSLAMLERLRGEGLLSRIVLSTWNEELRDNPAVLRLADKYGCELAASRDPGIALFPGSELKSSMGPQTIGLRQALALLDDDGIVLKTRPDIVFNEGFLRRLLASAGDRSFDAPQGSPFRRKIWVPWADLIYPFLIADECFLGRCGDLKLLASDFHRRYRPGKFAHAQAESAHVLRYLAPFATGVFGDFHRNWPYLQYEIPVVPGDWTEYLPVKFRTRAWWVMLAKYASILCDNFVIDGGGPGDIVFYVKSGDRSNRTAPREICHFYPGTMIPIAINENAFFDNLLAARARVLILNDMRWLRKVRYGAIAGDQIYDTIFLPALAQMQGCEARGEIPDLGAAIRETVRAARPETDFSILSHPDWQIDWLAPARED